MPYVERTDEEILELLIAKMERYKSFYTAVLISSRSYSVDEVIKKIRDDDPPGFRRHCIEYYRSIAKRNNVDPLDLLK